MNQTPEIVITGIGVVSPIGIGVDAFWDSVQCSRSGVQVIQQYDSSAMPSKIGAEVLDFDPKQHVKPRKSLKVMCREIQTGFAAAAMAANQAGLAELDLDRERIGSTFGSQMLYGELPEFVDLFRACVQDGEFNFDRFGESFPTTMNPLWMLKYLPNMPSCHIAIGLDARGPNNSIVVGDASSLLAIIEAVNYIQRGIADVMVTGGTGSRLSVTPRAFRGDCLVARDWNDRPTEASRPFDANRNGMVNGEGAGAIVLERADHATARGAKVLARIAGYGATVDTDRDQNSRKEAVERSIRQALLPHAVTGDQLLHLNAHGLSTIFDDQAEAQAINAALPDVPVTAPKSLFGNLGPGGGTVELIASVLSLSSGLVPATLNYHDADVNCPVNVSDQHRYYNDKAYSLSLNQSGTGQAAAILLARP